MNISNIINSIVSLLDKFQEIKSNARRELYVEFNRLKRKLVVAIFQSFFYCVAVGLILASAIIFFARFFALEAVLLGVGLVLVYVAAMLKYYYR